MSYSPTFAHEFIRRLASSHPTGSHTRDFPTYNFHDASDQELLATSSRPDSFHLGTGASIFTNCLLPAITSARHEVIVVTCFWAPSKTLTALCDALTKLAAHRRVLIQGALSRGSTVIPPLTVRICFSSRSLLQKLLHPQSRDGYTYPPSSWKKKLGLPDPALLEAGGIQLQVKSLFFLPFSVMHPKFVIIDRQRAFMPSCNVSWEPWLEGCVEIYGDAVEALFAFYSRTWEKPGNLPPLPGLDHGAALRDVEELDFDIPAADLTLIGSTAHYCMAFRFQGPLLTLVLPSSSHRNPRFRPFPWQTSPAPPDTPLNIALLQLFEQAQRSIYIQTPNITCEAVIAAFLDALARGVDVTIVTNRSMMLLEQLVTGGTTTSWSIRSFIRRFQRLKASPDGSHMRHAVEAEANRDLEAGRQATGIRVGRLRISYFHARSRADPGGREGRPLIAPSSPQGDIEEPVHSHLKLTLVDAQYAVLGSGNLDRPSWFTSQELGIMFHDHEFCARVKSGVEDVLEGRLDLVFDSEDPKGD
ncbi:hypothetical protein C8A01DRAFT_37201 [Parachaetomium inaequale]|uniref:PLD phosphodiesterase domain-containing protein n=1 Tax=Parachaetomium inaequale TaxID=2588326 RepID=A0AAN6PDG1_9PEZI|nr:hypothetical protein C8A01DRAFT_37201 [Parachaetomium inaequale]